MNWSKLRIFIMMTGVARRRRAGRYGAASGTEGNSPTKWAVNKFEDWITKMKVEVNVREVQPATLSGILKRFYGEVRWMQGSDLSPSTLV